MKFRDWLPILLWPTALLYALLCTLIVPRFVKNLNSAVPAILALPAIVIEKYLMDNSGQSLVLLFDFYFAFVVAGAFFVSHSIGCTFPAGRWRASRAY
jgi:hypothetical protein